jgi:hypothetical protein
MVQLEFHHLPHNGVTAERIKQLDAEGDCRAASK